MGAGYHSGADHVHFFLGRSNASLPDTEPLDNFTCSDGCIGATHVPLSWRKPTKKFNSSKYTINPRAHHIVPTRTIVANTQHQHNELNAEAINSKRVIWSKSTWCDSKRTEKMFLEMNQKNRQNWKSKKTTNLDTLLPTCTVRALQHDLLHQRTLQRWLCARCVLVSQSEHQCSPRASRK